ncbi:TraB/GumN family protein [Halobacteriales archaeon Cl-PHB]
MTESGSERDDLEPAAPTDLPPSERREGSVTVLGTAHVSPDSVAEVEETIERDRPDVVAVELDESRYRQLKGEEPEDLDASDVLKGNTVFQFLAYWLLSYVQTRLGDRFDIQPGADMMAAVDTAEELGLGVALVDRDIQETVRRLWKRMRLREKLRLAGSLLIEMGDPWTVGISVGFFVGFMAAFVGEIVAGPFLVPAGLGSGIGIPLVGGIAGTLVTMLDGLLVASAVAIVVGGPLALLITALRPDADYEDIDIENLTDADVVTAMMEEFRRFSPGGAQALIDERDAFIAHRLLALREAGYHVVAVVGAGHREGIEHYLEHPDELPDAETLVGDPGGSRLAGLLYKAFGYAFTLGFLVFFVLLALGGAQSTYLIGLFAAWFLVNGIAAAGLARLAGAHWTSAGVGGAVAWLTSVNPLLAPGWFAGYVELRYLDVNVSDVSKLNEILGDEEAPLTDIVQRMREVPLFRLILVVAMTNIGSFIASVLFATYLISGPADQMAQLMIEGAYNGAELLWGLFR